MINLSAGRLHHAQTRGHAPSRLGVFEIGDLPLGGLGRGLGGGHLARNRPRPRLRPLVRLPHPLVRRPVGPPIGQHPRRRRRPLPLETPANRLRAHARRPVDPPGGGHLDVPLRHRGTTRPRRGRNQRPHDAARHEPVHRPMGGATAEGSPAGRLHLPGRTGRLARGRNPSRSARSPAWR